jgi:hypothetical protein
MNPLESLQHIAKMTLQADLYYSKVYKYKSGLFNPILQEIQGISFEDGSVLNSIKTYSVGGLKYTLIPPGTEILVGFVNADPGLPYLAGVDPRALTMIQFSGQLTGILASATSPVTTGATITLSPLPV